MGEVNFKLQQEYLYKLFIVRLWEILKMKHLLLLLCGVVSFQSYAQQNVNKADSLKIELTKKNVQTDRIDLLNQIAKSYWSVNLDSAKNYFNKALIESKKVNYSKGLANAFNGINFWKNDRINVPDFASSRNLLPNPSFESGLRYYNNFFTWGKWPGRDYDIYNIDTDNARSGKRSLRISAFKAYPNPNYLSTFTIPTKPGKKYTFSFYAKSDAPGQRLDFNCVTAQWLKFPKHKIFKLTGSDTFLTSKHLLHHVWILKQLNRLLHPFILFP